MAVKEILKISVKKIDSIVIASLLLSLLLCVIPFLTGDEPRLVWPPADFRHLGFAILQWVGFVVFQWSLDRVSRPVFQPKTTEVDYGPTPSKALTLQRVLVILSGLAPFFGALYWLHHNELNTGLFPLLMLPIVRQTLRRVMLKDPTTERVRVRILGALVTLGFWIIFVVAKIPWLGLP